jgi:hypothetical protein
MRINFFSSGGIKFQYNTVDQDSSLYTTFKSGSKSPVDFLTQVKIEKTSGTNSRLPESPPACTENILPFKHNKIFLCGSGTLEGRGLFLSLCFQIYNIDQIID